MVRQSLLEVINVGAEMPRLPGAHRGTKDGNPLQPQHTHTQTACSAAKPLNNSTGTCTVLCSTSLAALKDREWVWRTALAEHCAEQEVASWVNLHLQHTGNT